MSTKPDTTAEVSTPGSAVAGSSDVKGAPATVTETTMVSESESHDPSVPDDVIAKLVITTLLMMAAPILTYYMARDYVFQGSSFYAALLAVVVANVVLGAFIFMAAREEKRGAALQAEATKKTE
ncbi:hypothetical protein IWQ60_001902 [Tieghemiomyces parasiticus]|uniref:Vacuolar ATPase assembly integral membrane protein VMA21 n=1 Tax=Tieghemiomyces parasiticus TaxID=78921 RepID=A0A9W8AJW8_9FUNG|nr:hypothetical protein IWQ60_001902 [Tieghemiomyces parasiticus]